MSSYPEKQEHAFLQILSGSKKGKAIKLLSSKVKMGRSSRCDLVFKEDPFCSPEHALILKEGPDYFIQSLDLKNPVFLNKKPVQKQALKQGDELQIGKITLRFVLKKATAPQQIQPASPTKKKLNPARLILILCVLGAGALFLLDTGPATKQELNVKTEEDISE